MGKKLAKKIKGDFKYINGSYYSNYLGYDTIIRYDYTSMLYNIYFTVKGKNDIKKLNDILNSIDEHAVARYKNNNLTISQACNKKSLMPDLVNDILDEVISYLDDNKYKYVNLCRVCQSEEKTSLVDIDSNISYACDKCYKKIEKDYEKELKEKKLIKERIIPGLFGAILGSIPGLIIWLILAYLKINPSVIGLIIMLGSAYFYRYMATSMKISGLIISLLIGFIFIIIANEISNAYILYNDYINQYNINIIDAYKAIPYYLDKTPAFKTMYYQNLMLSLMFALFGGLTNFRVYTNFRASNKIRRI